MTDGGPPALPRLSRSTLAKLEAGGGMPRGVTGPKLDPTDLSVGIVHFGIGAFHRAHQALFTEDAAAAAGQSKWGILGVAGRTDASVRGLAPQDGLYGILVPGVAGESEDALRLVGSIVGVVGPGSDGERAIAAVADPRTRIATLTITERGYRLRPDGGGADLLDPDNAHDLALLARELGGQAGGEASRTPIGTLLRGLARRFATGGAPFSVVSCDNLPHNGGVTRRVVGSFVDALPPEPADRFRRWIAEQVGFPSTMVDRITPATTEVDRARAAAMLGLRDEALVVTEAFTQWIIEDDFPGGRPDWELAGAVVTGDVEPYEQVKLRVLNATHSLLAWAGSLRGHATIASAVGDHELAELARQVIDRDILPTLVAPMGVDLAEYRDLVFARFANPALPHSTAQVAADGSIKLAIRIIPSVRARLAAGAVPRDLALVVAAWIAYVADTAEPGRPPLVDPLADLLLASVGSAAEVREHPAVVVDRMLAITEVFPPDVARSREFRDAVVAALVRVIRDASPSRSA